MAINFGNLFTKILIIIFSSSLYGLVLFLIAKAVKVKDITLKKAFLAAFYSVIVGAVVMLVLSNLLGMGINSIIIGLAINLIIYLVIIKMVFKASLAKTLIIWLIIALLNGMGIFSIVKEEQKDNFGKKNTIAKMDLVSIETALAIYELDNGSLPTTEEGVVALFKKPASASNWKGPYLKAKPLDPWGREYKYRFPGAHSSEYDLYSLGKDGVESVDDIANWGK